MKALKNWKVALAVEGQMQSNVKKKKHPPISQLSKILALVTTSCDSNDVTLIIYLGKAHRTTNLQNRRKS